MSCPWSSVQKTIIILLLLLNTVIDVPVAQVVQVPLYLTVSCMVFAVRLWSTRLRIFLGVCFRKYLRIHHFLVRQWIHVGFSLRGLWKNFTRFIREGGSPAVLECRRGGDCRAPTVAARRILDSCCMLVVCNDRCVVDDVAQFIDVGGRRCVAGATSSSCLS